MRAGWAGGGGGEGGEEGGLAEEEDVSREGLERWADREQKKVKNKVRGTEATGVPRS